MTQQRDMKTLPEILRGLLDFSPSRFQRQMRDGSVKQLTGMDVFNEAIEAIAKELMGIIGEDEDADTHVGPGVKLQIDGVTKTVRNQLRATQRARLTAFIEGVEK